ncbi:guanylate cyclase D-like [Paramacrobiotus metropolitanus]|uniref:guanylate cyclase D-like n=1 Tax=Paramacrobiotus metropolitanus TaxID=2943436 RepID=UPI002445FE6C|nr:guanylate cyclase D-like [Paramacrobiotus metropolitanus]
MAKLGKYRPGGTIVSSLLNRLEQHAENLENIVAVRTQELLSERAKVDALLGEVIPPSLVPSLRNKVLVPPETYDSVTIMFSSMVGFDVFCSSSAPIDAQNFLNDLYTFMDSQLLTFDVYKVETIKDGEKGKWKHFGLYKNRN